VKQEQRFLVLREQRFLLQLEQRGYLRPLVQPNRRDGALANNAGARAPQFQAPQRILGRSVAAPTPNVRTTGATEMQASSTHTNAANPLRYWTGSSPATLTAGAAAPDLNRLTEQVIHTLDQRLVTARERLSHKTRG
jgi:hypothetical protein